MASPPASPTPGTPFFVALVALLVAAGCGSAVGGGASKAADSSPGSSPKDDSETDPAAALDRAERDIAMLFGPSTEITSAPTASASPAEPTYAGPPPLSPAQQPSPTADPLSGNTGSEAPAGDPCLVACRALASMQRAANHLCGLSGEAQDPCASARERVKNANARVAARCACTP